MSGRLDGLTALVTGASRGIGKATAEQLAAEGARVILAARSLDALETLQGEIEAAGGEALALTLDLADPEGVAKKLKGLPKAWVAVDILVNNAGMTRDGLLVRMSLDQWEDVLSTNLTGSFIITKSLLRGMMKKRWGRIINITSVVGLMGNVGQANYAAAKAGLIGLTKSLARELASRNITVNAIAPGYIETTMTEAMTDKAKDDLSAQIPLGRLGRVEDIAAAVVFLASRESGYITGHVLNVSGGLYI